MPFTVLNSFLYAVPFNPQTFLEIRKLRCREVKKLAKDSIYNKILSIIIIILSIMSIRGQRF